MAEQPFWEIYSIVDGEREYVGTQHSRQQAEQRIQEDIEEHLLDQEFLGELPYLAFVIEAPDLTGCARGLAGQWCRSDEHGSH